MLYELLFSCFFLLYTVVNFAFCFAYTFKVDTLRLAIGYIGFLAELVANDRHPTDVLQNVVPEPPKKIFISSTKGKRCNSPVSLLCLHITSPPAVRNKQVISFSHSSLRLRVI